MALQPIEAAGSGDFQLGFGSNVNFQTASEIRSPPRDSRKRSAQHDKGQSRGSEEKFVEPELPKKHKTGHSTNVRL